MMYCLGCDSKLLETSFLRRFRDAEWGICHSCREEDWEFKDIPVPIDKKNGMKH